MHIRVLAPVLTCAACLALAFPRASDAIPVGYIATGVLSTAGTDTFDLEGATIRVRVLADTDDSPTIASSFPGQEFADFRAHPPLFADVSFTNRPNGALDETAVYEPNILLANRFSPSPTPDSIQFNALNQTATVLGTTVTMPNLVLSFDDQLFFAGTGTPSLPFFDPSDIGQLQVVSPLVVTGTEYTISGLTIEAIPEPSTASLLALGLAVMAWRRSSRSQ